MSAARNGIGDDLPVDELDVFTCALEGVTQIEASAGTGKTWNICALYVRLLLEKQLEADEILVVTFTKAATAELHERIRGRLSALEFALQHADAGGDPFVERLFETTLAGPLEPAAALTLVRRALRKFDQSAIHTIHAFCQRALQEAPFAAALPFEFELATDDDTLRFGIAADFWRARVEPRAALDAGFAAWLVRQGAGPAALDAQLARRSAKPLAKLHWDPVEVHAGPGAGGAPGESAAGQRERFDAAHTVWRLCHDEIRAVLRDAQPYLNKTTHKPAALEEAYAAWQRHFAADDVHATPDGAALKLAAAALRRGTKVRGVTPVHPFFDLAEALAAAASAAATRHAADWLALLREWLEVGPAQLREQKRASRTVSFDDLLADLQRVLAAHPWLALALRQRYPAALIDEFQDTDPLQFDIFKRIFAPAGPLFLVGDPKQAIYSFRAADLHTYLQARHEATARYTLAVNQRSTAPLIDACNRIFAANPHAFVLDGLDYTAVRPGIRERPALIDEAPGPVPPAAREAALTVWLLPQDAPLAKPDAQAVAAEACAAEIARLLGGARDGTVRLGATPLAAGDIAVLVQTHRQGSLIKRVLAAWGLGSVELAQASVFAAADAEQIERVMLAIATPGDSRRLRGALAADWLGLDAQALWRMERASSGTLSMQGDGEGGGAGDVEPADAATSWVERFTRYRTLWHERGFAVMWRTLLEELRVLQWLAARPDGERRLTDLRQLEELIQAYALGQPASGGIAPVLRWFAAQRANPGGGEEAQLRLESDQNLVQIVTVHKSKGLEYAVVFCPFLGDGAARARPAGALPEAHEYRDDDGTVWLDYGTDPELAALAARQHAREQAAERVRLIYVALTRAVYRCYLVGGVYASGAQRSTREACRSVLHWLIGGAGREFDAWFATPTEPAVLDGAWHALAGGAIAVRPVPLFERRAPLPGAADDAHTWQARSARRLLRERWRMASFSSLVGGSHAGDALAAAGEPGARPDHDAFDAGLLPLDTVSDPAIDPFLDAFLESDLEPSLDPGLEPYRESSLEPDLEPDLEPSLELGLDPDVEPSFEPLPYTGEPSGAPAMVPPEGVKPAAARAADDILNFPRGAAAGECLHRLFELADFSAAQGWPLAIGRALAERPVAAPAAVAPRMPAMMARLLADLTRTELVPGMILARLDPARRLNELEFLFPAPALDFSALRKLLRAHGYPEVADDAALRGTLRGFIKGFIDLVCEHAGRFWIVDWKSNHLGDTPRAYGHTALDAAMAAHGYHLQALLYSVALHRYLRLRVPGYRYETHVGGCLYLFVRGVRPAWRAAGAPTGVRLERPGAVLVDALDALMDGGAR